MIEIGEITIYVNTFLLIFARVIGLIVTSPLIKLNFAPPKIGVYLALTITTILYFVAPSTVSVMNFEHLMFLIVCEFLLGASCGLITLIAVEVFNLAGQFIANSIGLSQAMVFNPSSGMQSNAISNIYILLGIGLLLALGAHLMALEWLAKSFVEIPLGKVTSFFTLQSIALLIKYVMEIAVSIALPFIFPIMLIQFTFAMINRAAQSFNLITVGLPLSLITGMVLLPLCIFLMESHAEHTLELMFRALKGELNG